MSAPPDTVRGCRPMSCGVEFVKWFWTGPWLVTCRQIEGHKDEHSEVLTLPDERHS